jgi:hypothetical protein
LNNKPGTGNCWKKGITVSEEFNLYTENNKHPNIGHSEIKSLQKPILLNKYNLNNNYQPGDQRLNTKSYNQLETEVLTTQDKNVNRNEMKNSEVRIDKSMTYEKAMDYLHNALINLDI